MDNLMEDTEEQNDFDNLREAIQAFFALLDLVARIRSQDEEIKRLREALDNMADLWLTVGGTEDNPVYVAAVAALEQKGGEHD